MGTTTSTTLWIATAIMTIGLLAFLFFMLKSTNANRHFFTLTSLVALIAATAYFAMATGHGSILVGGRTFFFARYIDWIFTTPLLLLDLSLLAFSTLRDRATLVTTIIAADVYMIVTGFVAGLLNDATKYVWFACSTVGFIVVLYLLVTQILRRGQEHGGTVGKLLTNLSLLTIVLWICYPIVWLLGTEGAGLLPLGGEVVIFAVLDVLAKIGFGFMLLTSSAIIGREPVRQRFAAPA